MKYMGGKSKIAKEILPIMLKNRQQEQHFVEPFIGGCNVIGRVDGPRIGGDSHNYLIAFYKALQNGWTPPSNINKELYNAINNNKDAYPAELVGCVGFCFTYAAKWFGGFIGNSKDVICVGRDRLGESYRSVEKAKIDCCGIDLYCCSYQDLPIPSNSIIYCDPPYKGTTGYKDAIDYEHFYNWCRTMKSIGHTIFVSEYAMPSDFICVWQKAQASSLTKDTGSKYAVEKLFTL